MKQMIPSLESSDHPFRIAEPALAEFVLAQTQVAIVLCDKTGRILFANPTATGLALRDPLGLPLESALPLEWVNSVKTANQPAAGPFSLEPVLEGHELRGIVRLKHTFNTLRYLDVKATPYPGTRHETVACVISLNDVTQWMTFASDAARLATIVRDSNDSILSKNLDGTILSWNPAAERLFGYTAQEIIGQSVSILFPPDRKNEFAWIIEKIRRDEGVSHHDTVRMRKNGTTVDVSITISPLHNESGAIVGASTISRNITERKRNQEIQRFLIEATNHLAASLDLNVTLQTLADQAVPFFADWCAVHVLTENDMVERAAFAHTNPAEREREARRPKKHALDTRAKHLVPFVIRTGTAEFFESVPGTLSQEAARDAEHLHLLEHLGLNSYLCLPLYARGAVLGAVTFVLTESGRRYTRADLDLASELVRRTGLAVDNARLYQESRAAQSSFELLAEASIELMASMNMETNLERFVRFVVPRFAEWCSINLVQDDGAIHLATVSHVRPEMEPVLREWAARYPLTPDDTDGTPNVIRTEKTEWVRDVSENQFHSIGSDSGLFRNENEYSQALDVRSYIIAPLAARGRVLGAMTFARSSAQARYRAQEVAVAQEMARRAAIAIDNTALYQMEQQARQDAQANASRVGALQRVTSTLATALTRERVAGALLEQALQPLDAAGGIVGECSQDGSTLTLLDAVGYSQDVLAQWKQFPLTTDAPMAEVARSGEPLMFESPGQIPERYQNIVGTHSDYKAWMFLPLEIKGNVLGVAEFSFVTPRTFTAADRAFATALARQCAQALERARLYESEQQARRAAEQAAHRSAWLTEASHLLSNSLDYKATLKQIAQLAVPDLSDWCQIHIARDDGTAEQLVVAHNDPDTLKWGEEYRAQVQKYFPIHWDAPYGLPHVLRTGKSELYPTIPDELVAMVSENETQRKILQDLGISSVMIVPLTIQDHTVGAITLVNTESRRHFDTDDLAFAELLAGRAAGAIENARLYQETQLLNAELEARVEQRTFELSEAYQELRREVGERIRAEQTMRTLLRISNALNSTLDTASVLDILLREAMKMMGGVRGFAGLRDAHGTMIAKLYQEGTSSPFEYTWERGRGLPGWVLEHAQPYVTNDAANDPVMQSDIPPRRNVTGAICTPIFDVQDHVIGFFQVLDKEDLTPFTGADVEFLMTLAPLASIALQNAFAYQQILRAEMALQDSNQMLRALTARIETIREEERKDIARELHDELGQALTALKMDLATLINALPKRSSELRARAQDMSHQIDATIKTVRRLSSQLRPGMLDDLGLGPSIEWYAHEFQSRTGIECRVSIPAQDLDLEQRQSTALFRIFQETLTNVARHANAKHVQVELKEQDNMLSLRIRDDGDGIDLTQARVKRSLGILGMRERTEMMHGTLEIEGRRGEGTVILVQVPLDKTTEKFKTEQE